MYACIHTPAFAVQAALRLQPELRRIPVAVLDGKPPVETVLAASEQAQLLGVAQGMSRLQAESFAGVRLLTRSIDQENAARQTLLASASIYSPRIEQINPKHCSEPCCTFVLDITGTHKLFGDAQSLASSLRRQSASCGFQSNIAVSLNIFASVCAARGLDGVTIIPANEEAAILGPLSVRFLDPSPELLETFYLWGITTCAQLASLSPFDLVSRLGIEGQRLRSLARGELPYLLTPIEATLESDLVETLHLDHPVELFEPLLFLLKRMIDQLVIRVKQHSLAIASLTISLHYPLSANASSTYYQRIIRPALPSQDSHRILKLIQLDFEAHPPNAAIRRIEVSASPGRPQIAQHGLFLSPSPEPGRLDILLARLRKLFGDDRVGSPRLIDSHRCDSFTITPFDPFHLNSHNTYSPMVNRSFPTTFRACRPPRAILVTTTAAAPSRVNLAGEHFAVVAHAGPWRRDGEWWAHTHWCREEWDVVLELETPENIASSPRACRIANDPGSECWYLEGTYD